MPEHLAARVHAGAAAFFDSPAVRLVSPPPAAMQPLPHAAQAPLGSIVPGAPIPLAPRRRAVAQWGGWIAAAACFVLAVAGWWRATRAPVEVAIPVPIPVPTALPVPTAVAAATPAELREKLLSTEKPMPWTATRDVAAQGATGDVVWSTSSQEGYMRIQGLARNDPSKEQYQLWIFDEAQTYPVDGGVFDVDVETGEVVVRIAAKIGVKRPKLFAVTVEKPGGVVVSKKERIVLTAKPV